MVISRDNGVMKWKLSLETEDCLKIVGGWLRIISPRYNSFGNARVCGLLQTDFLKQMRLKCLSSKTWWGQITEEWASEGHD